MVLVLNFNEEPWVSYVTPKGSEMFSGSGYDLYHRTNDQRRQSEFLVDEDNDWTVYTGDDGLSAQIEYMVRITEDGAVVMTK